MLNEDQKEYVVTQIIKEKIEIKELRSNAVYSALYLGIITLIIIKQAAYIGEQDKSFYDLFALLFSIGAEIYTLHWLITTIAEKAGLEISAKKLEQMLEINKLDGGKSK